MTPARGSDDVIRRIREKKTNTAKACASRAATKLIGLLPKECRSKLSVEQVAEVIASEFKELCL